MQWGWRAQCRTGYSHWLFTFWQPGQYQTISWAQTGNMGMMLKVVQPQTRACCPVGNVCRQGTNQMGELRWHKTGIKIHWQLLYFQELPFMESTCGKCAVCLRCVCEKWVYCLICSFLHQLLEKGDHGGLLEKEGEIFWARQYLRFRSWSTFRHQKVPQKCAHLESQLPTSARVFAQGKLSLLFRGVFPKCGFQI